MVKNRESLELGFGTSGIRGKVEIMTDMECYINTRGFINYLIEIGDIKRGDVILIAGDLRSSTDRIMLAVAKAIKDSGCKVSNCGKIPSPALMYYGLLIGCASIMVTGSHIPEDSNGIKFNKKCGEVLKTDEKRILVNVAKVRTKEYANIRYESHFDKRGMFKRKPSLPPIEDMAKEVYIQRYLNVFPENCLSGTKLVLYQHSTVGRDIIKKVFKALGGTVIAPEEETDVKCTYEEKEEEKKVKVKLRSKEFVPVDTENITNITQAVLKKLAETYRPNGVISADGDCDRPLLADENGTFIPGDKLGALVSLYLKPDFAAIPISANDAVVDSLKAQGIQIIQTKIGSPYVIKAMNKELARNPKEKVVSWEVNGGFLTGSDWIINDKKLKALPTRDAVLPLIATTLLMKTKRTSFSELITTSLPSWETQAGIINNKTPRFKNYTQEMGKDIIEMFSPNNNEITEVKFTVKGVESYDKNERVYPLTETLRRDIQKIKKQLEKYFNQERGFDAITKINYVDGIKITFMNNEISHLRPSGNAPEFRNYVQAVTIKRAEEMATKRFEILLDIMAHNR